MTFAGKAHTFGSFERAAADEDGQASKQRLLLERQQVVAPGDCLAQGAVARWRVENRRLQIEPSLETGQEHRWWQQSRARRGELDCQR
jgi:hypothetical protein